MPPANTLAIPIIMRRVIATPVTGTPMVAFITGIASVRGVNRLMALRCEAEKSGVCAEIVMISTEKANTAAKYAGNRHDPPGGVRCERPAAARDNAR